MTPISNYDSMFDPSLIVNDQESKGCSWAYGSVQAIRMRILLMMAMAEELRYKAVPPDPPKVFNFGLPIDRPTAKPLKERKRILKRKKSK